MKAELSASTNNKLLKVGVVGSVITAICCFTPILSLLFGLFGLTTVIGYLDYFFLPILAIFVLITVYAFWMRQRA
ncbi:MAG: mercury resistance system transport protein MerF [Rhizobiaceae bacterium]|nr:mercury resistance system transport protein MerF [Rhizobiaceae bacterium]